MSRKEELLDFWYFAKDMAGENPSVIVDAYIKDIEAKKMKPMITEYTNLTETSIMPYGMYKGFMLKDVPEEYLVFVYKNNHLSPSVARYVEQNIEKEKLEK